MPFVGAVDGFFLDASKGDRFAEVDVLDGFDGGIPEGDGLGGAIGGLDVDGGDEPEVAVVFEECFGGLAAVQDAGE